MNQQKFTVQAASEVGVLKSVLLHRPGTELESLTPQYLDSMLFEDIPFLAKMQEEHDQFAETLRDQGCEIRYVEDLLKDLLEDDAVREQVIEGTIASSGVKYDFLRDAVREFLNSMDLHGLVEHLIGGVLKDEVDDRKVKQTLSYYIRDAYPYYIAPLPNLYFTRDPGTVIGSGLSINAMKSEARKRETWMLSLICSRHPLFADTHIPIYKGYAQGGSIEGGDILVLSDKVLAVGCSDRTEVWAIEELAGKVMLPREQGGQDIQEILVIQLPFTRAYMHLDTVFTMVDIDKYTIFPGVEHALKVFRMIRKSDSTWDICAEKDINTAMKKALRLPAVDAIYTGGGDLITAAREQWNDSTNTLAVAPGTVVTYRRNVVSNETLENHGVRVLAIEGSELVRGRGGPRCMSMPLFRETLD